MSSDGAIRLGFLGAGQMATALARGWLQAQLVNQNQILASDPSPGARSNFERETGITPGENNLAVVQHSNVLLLAVKPQNLAALLTDIRPALNSRHLVISIAAGFPLNRLSEHLGADCRLVRVMPNTPCLVGASASAYCGGGSATAEDLRLVDRLLNTVGLAFQVPEKMLDAVTGLSGSGPAYAFVIIEALSDGGVRMGLPRDIATQLAAQTLLGAARMLLETGHHPGTLKDMVTSPGGTTIAGLHALERSGLRAALMNAVEAATLRSMELGK